MTKKKDLPPMPEHDGSDNCPACNEADRVIKEMEAGPIIARFKKMAGMIKAEHEAIEKEFGVRMSTVFISTLQNEETDRIGVSPKEIMVKSKDKQVAMDLLQDLNKQVAMDLLQDLNKQIIMPDLMEKLGELFGGDKMEQMMSQNKQRASHHRTFLGGPGGEA